MTLTFLIFKSQVMFHIPQRSQQASNTILLNLVAQGKKERIMERRILKDFQIGMVEGVINEIITGEEKVTNIFGKIAKVIGKSDSTKRNWNEVVRKSTIVRNPIGSTDEAVRKSRQQSIRR